MGLFDDYFNPQTFSGESGGLFGRLVSQQQEQGQYQPGVGFDQTSAIPPTPSLPQTPDYGQTQNVAVGGYQMPQFGRADISQPLPQPTPDLVDRLSAGFQSWAHTPVGSPMAALANGIAGFGSGQRTDSAGVTPAQTQTPSSSPDFSDRLSGGIQSWAHTPVGNPMAAIANGITGFGLGQRIVDPATQISQARLVALKSLLGDQDTAPAAVDPQVGNSQIAQPMTPPPASHAVAATGNPTSSPRKPGANVPWSIKPNVQPWSDR